MSYCDTCGYPAPCGREHYWLEMERLEDMMARESAAKRRYCTGCEQMVWRKGPWCELYEGEGRTCVLHRPLRPSLPT
jgi:hypothetical protein